MKGVFKRVPISTLRRNPLRHEIELDEVLKALAASWLAMPMHPIVCRQDMTVVDGHRRLEGLAGLNETEVDVFVTEQVLTESDLLEAGWATSFHRKGLSGHDQFTLVSRIEAENPALKYKEIAQKLGVDPGTVTKILSPSSCRPEVREALRRQEIGITDAYKMSRMTPEQQLVALSKKLKGARRAEVEAMIRQATTGEETPEAADTSDKQTRIKMPVTTETVSGTVTISGVDLDLSAGESLLKEALRAIRKARDTGLDTRTAVAYWRDVAAAT